MLFGGSFDPPHRAHVELPVAVRAALEHRMGCEGSAWLLYVPSARSPLKRTRPVAADEHRVQMLRLALRGIDRASVWTDEIDRAAPDLAQAPSYTIETVERLRSVIAVGGDANQGEGTSIRLLIGADQAAKFHEWREYRKLLALAEPVVMLRAEDAAGSGAEAAGSLDRAKAQLLAKLGATGAWTPDELKEWEARIVEVPMHEASSTGARELLSGVGGSGGAEGGGSEQLSRMLHPDVLAYAVGHALYVRPPASQP